MKIYTKTGDAGETGLIGGRRVQKADPRVEAYGSVDETNAQLGLACTRVETPEIKAMIPEIQRRLFSIGAQLADSRDGAETAGGPAVTGEDVAALEAEIDRCEATLPALKNFILPGGTPGGALLHLSRTVCRRAERRTVEMAGAHPVPPLVSAYLNRLSDLLFVWARAENRRAGAAEVAWEGRGGR